MSRVYKSVIAALLLAAFASPAAYAETAVETSSIRVVYADLNLSTKAGATTLLNRMKAATGKVCGRRPSPKQIAATIGYRTCRQDAMSHAVADVNAPLVTALFTGEAGRETAAR